MRQGHYTYLENLTTELSNWIHDTKFEYRRKLGVKLINLPTSAKTYQSTLKTYGRKIPVTSLF